MFMPVKEFINGVEYVLTRADAINRKEIGAVTFSDEQVAVDVDKLKAIDGTNFSNGDQATGIRYISKKLGIKSLVVRNGKAEPPAVEIMDGHGNSYLLYKASEAKRPNTIETSQAHIMLNSAKAAAAKGCTQIVVDDSEFGVLLSLEQKVNERETA